MGFHYKFQKLLEIEKCKEEKLVKELTILQKQLHDDEKLLVFLQSVLAVKQSEMEKELCKQSEAKILIIFESYFSKLNSDIAIQRAKAAETSKKVECARENLLHVFKKRKTLEKLRERHEKEYREMLLKQENKHFDEIAISKYYFRHKKKQIH